MGNVLKVIAKDTGDSCWILAEMNAPVTDFTPVIIYNLEREEASPPRYLGSVAKFMPIIVKDYNETVQVGDEKIKEIRDFAEKHEKRSRRR